MEGEPVTVAPPRSASGRPPRPAGARPAPGHPGRPAPRPPGPGRPAGAAARPAAPRPAPRPPAPTTAPAVVLAARAGSIRWDRVGRAALLGVLGMILVLYASPLARWVAQSRTADEQRAELRRLEDEHGRLAQRAAELQRPGALEREARELGMVRRGERAYVIQR